MKHRRVAHFGVPLFKMQSRVRRGLQSPETGHGIQLYSDSHDQVVAKSPSTTTLTSMFCRRLDMVVAGLEYRAGVSLPSSVSSLLFELTRNSVQDTHSGMEE
jgi:hypothetical protein